MNWETLPSNINPVAFRLGNFEILWYSISYLLAFLTTYLYLKLALKKERSLAYQIFASKEPLAVLENLFIASLVGLFLGARIGFWLFYDLANFLANPLAALLPFREGVFVGFSGLSFHGALLGVVLAGIVFCHLKKLNFLQLANFIIPAIPLGYFWGRLGNFMNGELYGRLTDSPLGMCFPAAGDCELGNRHPSQLYEALGEGLLLFLLLWYLQKTKVGKNHLFAFWLILYGMVRFVIEFFRAPDAHLGLLTFNLSMGQILCFLMIVIGLILIFIGKTGPQTKRV